MSDEPDKNLTPAELGTRMHQEIEECIRVGKHYYPTRRGTSQVLAYLRAWEAMHGSPGVVNYVLMGDVWCDPATDRMTCTVGPDVAVVVQDGGEYKIDYKLTEERLLAYCRKAVELDLKLDGVMDEMVKVPADPEKIVKPSRGRRKDWEQRER